MENFLILNNDVKMPNIGLGTFLLSSEDAYNSTLNALKMGYRLIDTANAYMNEKAVGRAIKDSKIKREDIFLSTKIWCSEYENENIVDETLKRLGVDYIDLLFIHQPTKNWRKGYEKLIKAYKEGKIKAIGISNFEGKYFDELVNEFDILPQVFQCECHPHFIQEETREKIKKYGIKLMSWYPLGGKGNTQKLLNDPIILSLSEKYRKSPSQIVLRWHIENGFIVIPGSKNIEHVKENLNIFDFSLNEDDLKEIEKLNTHERQYIRTDEALKNFEAWQPEYEKD